EYLDTLLPPRDALLARVEEYAEERGQPIADPEVAQVERILVRALRPRRIIEVGTNIGYSVIVMGRECGRETVLETIEIDREILATGKKFVAEGGPGRNAATVMLKDFGTSIEEVVKKKA